MDAEEIELVENYYDTFYKALSVKDQVNFFNYVRLHRLQTEQPEEIFFDFLSCDEELFKQEFHPADLCH